jgi:hypothetical protein
MSGAGYRQQQGMTISKLLMICIAVGAVGLVGLKLTPEYIEYFKIKSNVMAIAQEANANPNVTVPDVRRAFERRADIDHIKGFTAAELDITKEGGQIVVAFEYERKVHLFKNISVLIDFAGSSAD